MVEPKARADWQSEVIPVTWWGVKVFLPAKWGTIEKV